MNLTSRQKDIIRTAFVLPPVVAVPAQPRPPAIKGLTVSMTAGAASAALRPAGCTYTFG